MWLSWPVLGGRNVFARRNNVLFLPSRLGAHCTIFNLKLIFECLKTWKPADETNCHYKQKIMVIDELLPVACFFCLLFDQTTRSNLEKDHPH